MRRAAWNGVHALVSKSWITPEQHDSILPIMSTAILRSAFVEPDNLVRSNMWQGLLTFLKSLSPFYTFSNLKVLSTRCFTSHSTSVGLRIHLPTVTSRIRLLPKLPHHGLHGYPSTRLPHSPHYPLHHSSLFTSPPPILRRTMVGSSVLVPALGRKAKGDDGIHRCVG